MSYLIGWWGLVCWDGLSRDQQRILIEKGVLPMGRKGPEGTGCLLGAQVAIETEEDEAPGPRFYCRAHAIEYLSTYAKDRP